MTTYVTSLIRTVVPIIIGWLLSLPIVPPLLDALGVTTERASTVLSAAFTAALSAIWYAAVRLLEKRWPSLGVLLGVPVTPTYDQPAKTDIDGDDFDLSGLTVVDTTAPVLPDAHPLDTGA